MLLAVAKCVQGLKPTCRYNLGGMTESHALLQGFWIRLIGQQFNS
jgi:hypothetical protein